MTTKNTMQLYYKVNFSHNSYKTQAFIRISFFMADKDNVRYLYNPFLEAIFYSMKQDESEVASNRAECPKHVHPRKWTDVFCHTDRFTSWNVQNFKSSSDYTSRATEFFAYAAKLLTDIEKAASKYQLNTIHDYDSVAVWLSALERLHAEQLETDSNGNYMATGNKCVYNPTMDRIYA